ncbi:MAG: PBP1A family penicillin-binding protein [Deltaproteobacteria bacterium]|nr:PBP1A family penicillin-binding protein [Deltaproteobacteria bacterium]
MSRWTWTARILVVAFFLLSVATVTIVGTLSYFARDLPTVEALRNYRPKQITRVLDRHGALIAELFKERRSVVPMAKIPRVLVLSVLAAEDADFYRHKGLDYAGIARALLRDLISGKAMQGASTITQQIVKNLLLTPERTITRKIRELILARRLEQRLEKDQILFLYLNHIPFGHGRCGVQEASRFYFNKDVDKLNLAEASLLAGIPQAPSRYSPITHPLAARRRQRYVLDQLEAKREIYWSDISLTEIRKARTAEIEIAKATNPPAQAPEVVEFARRILRQQVGGKAAESGGYTIETTVDSKIEIAARAALRAGLIEIDQRQANRGPLKAWRGRVQTSREKKRLKLGATYDAVVTGADDERGLIELDVGGHRATADMADLARFNPTRLQASRFAQKGVRVRFSVQQLASENRPLKGRLELGPQGAVVVIDPRSRDVLALVGGDEAIFGFDRAMNAIRQPGSAFKPIVYALALSSGRFTPATLVLDAPEVFDEWKPNNYETWHYEGAVRLREALAKSINLVAIRVTKEMTPVEVVKFAKKLGVTSQLEPSLALGLGASGVRPIELVNAYATFAAGGRYQPYRIIRRITDQKGQTVKLPRQQLPSDVMTPAAAYLVTSLLTSVVREGTATAARKLHRPAAGKTGTSNRARDAWFVGYTPEVVVGVWVGYDDDRPLGKGESGAKSALPIWIDVVGDLVKARPVVDFPVPSGVVTVRIDPETGLLAYEGMQGAIEEVFLSGTAPVETARPPDLVDTSTYLIEQLGGLKQ